MLAAAAILVTAGQLLGQAVGFFDQGRHNADPSFLFTQLDLCCVAAWLLAAIGLLMLLIFTRGTARAVAITAMGTCVFAIMPAQCAFRQLPPIRYEVGFLRWAAAHVRPAPIAGWWSTLPAVKADSDVPPAVWPPVVALLKPARVIEGPAGIILEWGRIGAWGNARRVFIGAAGTRLPPTNDENALFPWKPLGPRFFGAYQIED